MTGKGNMRLLWAGLLALSLAAARAQTPQQLMQQVVDSERTANRNDHSQWIYLEESDKPKEHLLQWVVTTPHGDVDRVLERDDRNLAEPQQRETVEKFLHDPRAQAKQVAENNHDAQQIDDFLKLLAVAFVWTRTGATASTASLHFEPSPEFHPPTREARVLSSMSGDVVVDTRQLRICRMKGRLLHDVTFGGGLLGRLKERSSFALEQQQVGPSLWQLTGIHVHLEGNALLFKSVSLQQDDKRSRFQLAPSPITLEQAADAVMKQPELFACGGEKAGAAGNCGEKLTESTGLKP